jgi:hypothetical protein
MANKYETSPELKKFMYGTFAGLALLIITMLVLKYGVNPPIKLPLKYSNAIILTSIFNNGIGYRIYRKRTANWPHFWAGITCYLLIATTLSGLFYFLD